METVLPIAPEVFWGSVGLLGFAVAVIVVWGVILPVAKDDERGSQEPEWVLQGKSAFGMADLNSGLFVLFTFLWFVLTGVLFAGLLWLLLTTFMLDYPVTKPDEWDFGFHIAQVAAFTAVLGAVVALPITLNRLRLAREANNTSQESLFNDKITEAAKDLYAQRQVTERDDDGTPKRDVWEDDITRRNAAIDRLEGLVKERPAEAGRVSRLLCSYVRELSREHPGEETPETEDFGAIREWAQGLRPVRSDMENAAQVLGRLAGIPGVVESEIQIDLRGANLQGFDLRFLAFPNNARFDGTKMQGADLSGAQMRECTLAEAMMQYTRLPKVQLQSAILLGTNLSGADMMEANLVEAKLYKAILRNVDFLNANMRNATFSATEMQSANLFGCQMQGTRIGGVQLQNAELTGTKLIGAEIINTNFDGAAFEDAHLQGAKLVSVSFGVSTRLSFYTNLRGAALRMVEGIALLRLSDFWEKVFSDGTVRLPSSEPRPDHWADEVLDYEDFETAWRAWQVEIGFDPDDPETWE